MINLTVNNSPITAAEGTTLAAAILNSGVAVFHHSITGEERAPLCGMGICFECRVTVNSEPHLRSCTVIVEEGMEVLTD